jgi:hypothetical protein
MADKKGCGGNAHGRAVARAAAKRTGMPMVNPTPSADREEPDLPWYEGTLLWGAVGVAVTLIATYVGFATKDIRWFLFAAWPFCILVALALARAGSRRHQTRLLVVVAGSLVAAAILFGISKYLPPPSDNDISAQIREGFQSLTNRLTQQATNQSGQGKEGKAAPNDLDNSGFSEQLPDQVTVLLTNEAGLNVEANLKTSQLEKNPFDGLLSLGGRHPISIYVENKRFYVDAIITDGSGSGAVEIKKNVFDVKPSAWDRNFAKNAIEVVDAHQRPIFQMIRKRSNLIQVAGLFSLPNGPVFDARPNKALFKYPAWKYPGQYADDAEVKIDPSLARMTPAELQSRLRDLCSGVRTLGKRWGDGYEENNLRAIEAIRSAKSDADRKQFQTKRVADNEQLYRSLERQFNNDYSVRARSLNTELVRRVNTPQEALEADNSKVPSLLLSGVATGPNPFNDVCSYLEGLSRYIQ